MRENASIPIPGTPASATQRVAGWIVVALAMPGYSAFAAEPAVTAKVVAPLEAIAGQAIKATLTQFKVVRNANGSEKFEDAARVKPGDILEYRVTYTNVSAKPVTGLVANLPIPVGLAYQARSAKPGADLVRMATADGRFATEPLSHRVDGNTVPVPYQDYRQIRWTLGQLPAGESMGVTARAQVETSIQALPIPQASSTIRPATSAVVSPAKR